MQNKETLNLQFRESTEKVLALVSQSGEPDLFRQPAPGKWSVAEIVEHLNISDRSAYIAMLKEGPPPDEAHLQATEKVFNGYTGTENLKLEAPGSAQPTGKFKTAAEMENAFVSARKKLHDLLEKAPLGNLALGFEHPRLGFLTREQWLRFIIWHAHHHAGQIQRTLGMLKNLG